MSNAGSGARLQKASDWLSDEVRAMILGEGLPEGASLPPEAELMERYELSRGTVREALRLLEADGLIVIKRGPKGGIRVRHPDKNQVTRSLALLFSTDQTVLGDLFTFRKLVEPEAAAEAARRASDDQRTWLAEIAPRHYGVSDRFRQSAEFHGAIGACSNNGVYAVMLASLHDALEWHASEERLSHDDIEATQRAHVDIADAIVKGNATAAARRMRRHLEQFESVLEDQGRLDEPIIPRSRWRQSSHTRP